MIPETKQCPYCKEDIRAEAVKCRYCGEFMDDYTGTELAALRHRYVIRGTSTVLSAVCPGFGQLFQWRLGAAFSFMLLMAIALLFTLLTLAAPRDKVSALVFVMIGVLTYLFNVYDAYRYTPDILRDNNPDYEPETETAEARPNPDPAWDR